MPDATSSTDSLHNVIPRLVYDARGQEDRAEAAEKELAAAYAQVQIAEARVWQCMRREHTRITRLLSFGCRECGASPALTLCVACMQPMCEHCIQDDDGTLLPGTGADRSTDEGFLEYSTNAYVCSLCA